MKKNLVMIILSVLPTVHRLTNPRFSVFCSARDSSGLAIKSMKLFAGFFFGTIALSGAPALGPQYQMLHEFFSAAVNPYGALIQGSDGNFYGTTQYGGAANKGTVFKIDSLGAVTTLHSFAGSDGARPSAGLIQGSDGNFYGTTPFGGGGDKGTIFKVDASGAMTTLHIFAGSDGAQPIAGLMQGSDGNFYGTTYQGGTANQGTVFKMDSSGVVTKLHSFAGSDGAYPFAGLIQGSDGNFYGTTQFGGDTGNGTVFKMDSSGSVTTLHSFAGQPLDGALPSAALIQGSDGNFYGTTYQGGTASQGTVFKMDSSGAVTTLHSFTGEPLTGQPLDGAYPKSRVIEDSDGNFYGTTQLGGMADKGTVFKMDSLGVVTMLHSFTGQPLDGATPYAGLFQGSDENFYGTTNEGGTADQGTVFKMDASGTVTTLYSFAAGDGTGSVAGLIQGSDENFYGTTLNGGTTNAGTVFKMDSSGNVTTLHSFTRNDGAAPYAGLIQGTDGNFYGTTYLGGTADQGTVFKMDSSGALTTLHLFAGKPLDGANPVGALIQGSDGNFYGTTYYGGTADSGTVFKMDSSGTVTTLHSFAGQPLDGALPYAGLFQASDGTFYGTTLFGGASDFGTVFKMDSSGALTTLHSFAGQPLDGTYPYAAPIQGSDGNFYATTVGGGANDSGTVFKIDSSGAVETLHSFTYSEGVYPNAGLIQGSDGNFYGTVYQSGPSNRGAVFKMDPSGAVTTLKPFAGQPFDGAYPRAGLIQGSDRNFYGTTFRGGRSDLGVVFRLIIPPVQLVSVVSRKTHGDAGTYDVALPLTGNPGIECRSGGASNDYRLVFTFVNNTTVASASVTGGMGSVSSSSLGPNPNQYTVNLTGVTNAQYLTVTLNGALDSTGNSGNVVGPRMGVLIGDTTSDGFVNSADIAQAKSQSGQLVTGSNFREDVTIDGNLNSGDIALVKSKSGTALP